MAHLLNAGNPAQPAILAPPGVMAVKGVSVPTGFG
jgi:hypothetical protein